MGGSDYAEEKAPTTEEAAPAGTVVPAEPKTEENPVPPAPEPQAEEKKEG